MSHITLLSRMFVISVVMAVISTPAVLFVSSPSGCRFERPGREAHPNEACERRLRDMGFAIGQYKQTHGRLPPPIVVGPHGDEHSWRAAMMPHLPHSAIDADLYNYRMDEPWDSAHNREVWSDYWLGTYFACPAETRHRSWESPYTSYLMLVRPSTASSTDGDEAMDELPPDAVLIVESAGCGIEYCEPRDLRWEDLWEGESPFGEGKLNSFHPRVVKAVRVDGKVIDIPKTTSREQLKKLLTGTVGTDE